MAKFSVKNLLFSIIAIWGAFAGLVFWLPPEFVFHILNPLAIALATVLMLVYSSGIVDIIRQDGAWDKIITPAHMLTFGVVMNWFGMIIRMARWYLTGQHPSTANNIDFWFYNFGLWISLLAGIFLLGAASLAVRPFRTSTLVAIFLCIFGFLAYLGFSAPPIGGGGLY